MNRRSRPIVRGNIVVWPVIPRLTSGVTLHRQAGVLATGHPQVTVLPVAATAWMSGVVLIEDARQRRVRRIPISAIGDIGGLQKRALRGNAGALERLREMFSHPA